MLLLDIKWTSLRKLLRLKVLRKWIKATCLMSTRKRTSNFLTDVVPESEFVSVVVVVDDSLVSIWKTLPLLT